MWAKETKMRIGFFLFFSFFPFFKKKKKVKVAN